MFLSIINSIFVKNLKTTIIVVALLSLLTFVNNKFNDYISAIEDREQLECNEEQLQAKIDNLNAQLIDSLKEKEQIRLSLEEMRVQAERRKQTIENLQSILDNDEYEDNLISERTRQFWLELNRNSKEVLDDEMDNNINTDTDT